LDDAQGRLYYRIDDIPLGLKSNMDGIFGWLDEAPALGPTFVNEMPNANRLPNPVLHAQLDDTAVVYGSSRFGKASTHAANGIVIGVYGRPGFSVGALATYAQAHGLGPALEEGWLKYGKGLPGHMTGTFALAVMVPARRQAFLAIDRVGAERLCYAHQADRLIFGTSAKTVATHPAVGHTLDLQAVYDFLYFHAVPSPRTIFQGIRKLEPAQFVFFENGKARTDYYWQADYTPAAGTSFISYRSGFRELLTQSVRDAAGETHAAAFLSGGTDSSTVVGTLTEVRGGPVDTFSIGFDAAGFDEMEYARCAAERFRARRHEYYLTPQDIASAVPLIAREYDEPFGNSSAVPTYFCAKAAREAGFNLMLAGDGGDEIFGGNARYAKQKMFEAYLRLPAALRRGLIEPIARLPGLCNHFPLRKLKSYVDQANIGLPLRLEAYNFLHRAPLANIFEPDFISAVDPSSTDRGLTDVYERTHSDHYINRLMHLDLKFTLADNDLRKVGTMTELAGIEVRYPLLDDRLVEFANHLPVDYKVRGHTLRWFFKETLRDLLPEQIINKSKHGFGLPFGIWCNEYAPLGELVHDSLSALGKRGWLRPAYLEQILRMQREQHASYYGVMVWVMMILEQWMQANEH
jgi:asparagine synthase (glutamine-hydrolysing)